MKEFFTFSDAPGSVFAISNWGSLKSSPGTKLAGLVVLNGEGSPEITIGEAARRSEVNAKMIRHYEAIGLVRPRRHANNYRVYTEQTMAMLRFIRHARDLAMPLAEAKALQSLWDGRATPEKVRAQAEAEIRRLENKAASLRAMAAALRDLA